MKVRVLGCSGGISREVATTSFLVDDDILIDCGTGVCDLKLSEMRKIRHIFITHSHLDHIASLPLLVDTLFDDLIGNPITIHAQRSTIKVLKDNIFNWAIWPDFTELPHKTNAVMKFQGMKGGEVEQITGRKIEMIIVNHAVPSVGYRVESKKRSFAFSGDTTSNENFWYSLNKHKDLDLLFVETAFANKNIDLSRMAFHYCPELLAIDLPKLKHRPDVYISHLKPGEEKLIMREIQKALPDWDCQRLAEGDEFTL